MSHTDCVLIGVVLGFTMCMLTLVVTGVLAV